jgi:hypothetical protein
MTKLTPSQRAEFNILYERLAADDDALQVFIGEAIVRNDRLSEAEQRCAELERKLGEAINKCAQICDGEEQWANGWLDPVKTPPGTVAWSEIYGARNGAIRCGIKIRELMPAARSGQEEGK